jgi:ABC-type transport system substrate-binding protein
MRLLQTLALLIALTATARAETTLTVAMTAGDIPITTGIPDQGSEGVRFVGYSLYDALVLFDLSHSDTAADIRPGLATSWKIDPNDPKRWLFTLREGVKWHDGCPFTPEDVVWNFKRILDKTSPQFDPLQFAHRRHQHGPRALAVSVPAAADHADQPVQRGGAEIRPRRADVPSVRHRAVPHPEAGGA